MHAHALLLALLVASPACGDPPGGSPPAAPAAPHLAYRPIEATPAAEERVHTLVAVPGKVSVEKATIEGFAVPGLAEAWNGRVAWRARIDGAEVRVGPPAAPVVNPYIAGFELWVDDRGALLLLTSIPKDPSQRLGPPLPDAEAAKKAMEATANRYVGIPSDPPKLTIAQVLDKAQEQGFAPLGAAKEIRVMRILQSRMGEEAIPVWVVHVRGAPPYPGVGPGATVSEEERSHLRLVYDDAGKLLFADNLLY